MLACVMLILVVVGLGGLNDSLFVSAVFLAGLFCWQRRSVGWKLADTITKCLSLAGIILLCLWPTPTAAEASWQCGKCILLLGFLSQFAVFHDAKPAGWVYAIELQYGERRIGCDMFLDTGNQLYTNSGGQPIVILPYQTLKPLLTQQVQRFLEAHSTGEWVPRLLECQDTEWLERVQIVPCQGIAGRQLLLAFRVDQITIRHQRSTCKKQGVYVAITTEAITTNWNCAGLLHPALVGMG